MLREELKRKDKLYHLLNINTVFPRVLWVSIPVSFCKYAGNTLTLLLDIF
jgi:hypothetical protein